MQFPSSASKCFSIIHNFALDVDVNTIIPLSQNSKVVYIIGTFQHQYAHILMQHSQVLLMLRIKHTRGMHSASKTKLTRSLKDKASEYINITYTVSLLSGSIIMSYSLATMYFIRYIVHVSRWMILKETIFALSFTHILI